MQTRIKQWMISISLLALVIAYSVMSAHGQGDNKKVTGSGTTNRIAKWTSPDAIGDSGITEDSSGNLGIGASPISTKKVLMESALSGTNATLRVNNTGSGRAIEAFTQSAPAVNAASNSGFAVTANSNSGYGLFASSQTNFAIYASGVGNDGLFAASNSSNAAYAAVRGTGVAGGAFAGRFNGNVAVSGMLSKGGGSFKIDHPLDPENKYLYHSFVESPEMMNIYNGNLTTNESGLAVVEMPEWFEALNRDFRYQLTVIGTFAQAIVAEKMQGNRFVIRTNEPGVEVSWQVTGVRQDAWANQNRIPTEELKPEDERGTYLHPEAFKKPEELGIEWRRDPETMSRLKAQRQKN